MVAHLIHENSARANGPMVEVNCAAIPSELIESELFGHMKGSFTGAVKDRAGKFEQADGGTLFLDEIGDMSLAAQTKVLRALQESLAEESARADGNLRLVHVVASRTHVGVLAEQHLDTRLLVFRQHIVAENVVADVKHTGGGDEKHDDEQIAVRAGDGELESEVNQDAEIDQKLHDAEIERDDIGRKQVGSRRQTQRIDEQLAQRPQPHT